MSDIGSLRYERNKFARRPFGGSLVIFTPTFTNKLGNVINQV